MLELIPRSNGICLSTLNLKFRSSYFCLNIRADVVAKANANNPDVFITPRKTNTNTTNYEYNFPLLSTGGGFMARLARSKDVEANLRVGVSGILQFSERFQQVKIRQPATLVGWKAGERFLLDAGTPTYQNSERLHDFLHERCIFRFIENHCAYAIEARLLDVSVQMGRRALWIGWPKCIHLYPYRAQMRSEVDVPCNIQVILMSGAGDVQHGQILDISSSGCCFSVPKPFSSSIKVGRTVLLSFQLEDSERPSAVEGLVRHSRDYESSHLYGLEFGAIPEELTEAIKLVLSQKPHFSNELEALRQRDL